MNESTEIREYEKLADRVNRAVDREDRRRRRARWFGFIALLVPVAVMVAVLGKGKTDTEWVQDNARVAVEPELKAAKTAVDGIKNVLPEVREAVSMAEDTRGRVNTVERRQAEQHEAQQEMLVRLDRQQRAVSQIAERVERPVAAQDPRVDELLERLHVLERKQENTRRDLIRMMEHGAGREPEDLENRLRVIERRLQISQ